MTESKVDLRTSYFQWLCDLVKANESSCEFNSLLKQLFDTEFTWIVANDDNRAVDGIILRERFAHEKNLSEYSDLNGRCSVLEMMVALASRCESDIMHEPNGEDRTSFWFWEMIKNVGLESFVGGYFEGEEAEVAEILDRVLNRTYDANGNGSFFPLKHSDKDLQETELWYQLQSWLQENYTSDDTDE